VKGGLRAERREAPKPFEAFAAGFFFFPPPPFLLWKTSVDPLLRAGPLAGAKGKDGEMWRAKTTRRRR